MADKSANVDLNFEQIAQNIVQALYEIEWKTWGAAVLYVLCGFVVAGFISAIASRVLSKYTSTHYTQLVSRLLYYGILALSLLFALSTLQLDVKVLGIATIITLGLGFASQTAMSNIISGLFLVFERPFSIGDHLEFNGVTGELLSIDLLSIKIRTFDNTLVRIPNEMLLKNQFSTLTKFPIRRLEIPVHISYNEDLDKVRTVLLELARKKPIILESPGPQFLFGEFTDNSIVFKFAVWVKREAFQAFKDVFPYDIFKALGEHGIKPPSVSIQIDK